jgi:D-galactose 1-dehydrogenase
VSTTPICVALVGLGKIARDQHLQAIADSPHFELGATADPGCIGLTGIPHFSTLEELLASAVPFDAVTLCTPPQVRHWVAALAIEAGKHVFLEKPPGVTVSEVASLADRAKAKATTLFAGWHSRFAGGVEPTRRWLAGRRMSRVDIVWREDVRVWHPGQAWIWQPGGLGVFDPGINALSIATHILDEPMRLMEAELDVPETWAMPIAARLRLRAGEEVLVSVDLDFRQTGPQSWDIRLETDRGTATLSGGGAALSTAESARAFHDREYPALYDRFAALIRARESDVDCEPLRLVEEALALGRRTIVAGFYD